jgi:methylglutaconyl-CoA hydratase
MPENGEAKVNRSVDLSFLNVDPSRPDTIALVSLAREEAANSFNREVILGLTEAFATVAETKNVRALILRGKGKHFSAGADLGWMKDAAKLSYEENLSDASQLTQMFELLYNLRVPTIALLHGSVFGGAVGLTACCDIVLAEAQTKFCLSEVRLGLLPAVIYPYLAKRIHLGQLRHLSLSAKVFYAEEALRVGLVDDLYSADTRGKLIKEKLNLLLSAGPEALASLKSLHQNLEKNAFAQSEETAKAIAKARTSSEGQAGLESFFAKQISPWGCQLSEEWDLP